MRTQPDTGASNEALQLVAQDREFIRQLVSETRADETLSFRHMSIRRGGLQHLAAPNGEPRLPAIKRLGEKRFGDQPGILAVVAAHH